MTEETKREQLPETEKIPVEHESVPQGGKINRFVRELTAWGTPACGLLCACIGLALAALLLTCGLWRTVFIAVLTAAGALIGGVSHKAEVLKKIINRLFPPKDQTL